MDTLSFRGSTSVPCREWLRRLRRSTEFLRPHKPAVASILALALSVAGLSSLEPLVLKRMIDEISARSALAPIAIGAVLLLGVGALREIASATSNWLGWRTRIRVQFALMEATVGRLHRLPLFFHRNDAVGATLTRLDRGIQGFVGAVTEIGFNLAPTLVYLAISAAVMIRLAPKLALVVLAFVPLPWLIATVAAREQTQRERQLLDRWVSIYSRFNEVLHGIVTVKSFTMEEAEKERFLREVDGANRVVIRGVATDAGIGASQNLVVTLARIAAIGYGGLLAWRGEISVGTVIAFLGYVGGLFGPVQGLSQTYKTLRTAFVSLEQVFSILDAQDSLGDAAHAKELTALRGQVSFESVRFAYPPGRRAQLEEIDLEVAAGEHVALVGPSGSGKSTMMALLCRFYDPTHGRIRVDGVDLKDVKQISLRSQIGVVLQDSLLFNESVAKNIAYGRPLADHEEIERAARAAHADEFIQRLSEGYDTIVGERGCRLSAGERQRIAIARSLLKDPAILILDEPTSALDAESESLVHDALRELMKGRTTFIIAHRLSTVVDAHRIIVLKGGRIHEQGTHEQLMRAGGYYASLVEKQTRRLARAA